MLRGLLLVTFALFQLSTCHTQISTWWTTPKDEAAALSYLTDNAQSFSSISLTATPSKKFFDVTKTLGIELFFLYSSGTLESFYTAPQREATIADVLNTTLGSGWMGPDLDFEHMPINATVTAAYSEFLQGLILFSVLSVW